MTQESRYVITPGVAIALATSGARIADHVRLVAPTLFRSQVLSELYQQVRDGRMSEPEATAALDYIRGLRMRLLGDRVLQSVAWKIAAEFDMADTLDAEYLALTKLQADHLVTEDPTLRATASSLISSAPIDQLVDHAATNPDTKGASGE